MQRHFWVAALRSIFSNADEMAGGVVEPTHSMHASSAQTSDLLIPSSCRYLLDLQAYLSLSGTALQLEAKKLNRFLAETQAVPVAAAELAVDTAAVAPWAELVRPPRALQFSAPASLSAAAQLSQQGGCGGPKPKERAQGKHGSALRRN